MVGELFSEIFHEISLHPQTFAIEVVQFVLLVLIVKVVAFGFGKRRGFVRNMLSERQERMAQGLERADTAPVALETARQEVEEKVTAARSEAAQVLVDARGEEHALRETADVEVEAEIAQMRKHAEETLATEFEEMHAEIRERLVELVAGATRSILNESYALSEQRALIQKAILSGIERIRAEENRRQQEAVVGEREPT
ncbi:MAG: ATP synthase F0 subunit B [Coriobacteriia bacterium]|nr:ATP synthase F0 subunit B [Coriobacteriia bacterium]